jgi:hypothetical protein
MPPTGSEGLEHLRVGARERRQIARIGTFNRRAGLSAIHLRSWKKVSHARTRSSFTVSAFFMTAEMIASEQY